MSSFVNHRNESSLSVDEACTKDNVTYYKITVKVGAVYWIVWHRYSDFVDLHDRLVTDHGVAKDLLPPKKVIRNKTPKFVEQRREALNEYLKSVFNYLTLTMPYEFAHFLDFHLYDIFFLLQDLAKKLFLEGDKMLQNEKSHRFTPMELHAISERLKIACPPSEKEDQMYDFSHVLDFCSQLRALNVEGSYEKLGTSNIVPNELHFDLVSFKNLVNLKILGVPMACIQSVGSLRETLVSLSVLIASVVSLNEFLLVDIIHRDPASIAETVKWKKLSLVNFSSNNIRNVDWGIKLVPKLQHLSFSSNKLTELCDISCLHELRVLNLSMNNFSVCDNWHAKIGNIVKIDLSQNKVESLQGFSRLYSLESLDLSCNLIQDVEEVQHICNLPCLEYLWLTANPVASSIDYRVKVIEQFNARMAEICLDNEKASEKELDTARVLQALRVVKEGRKPSFLQDSSTSHTFNKS
ncbi:nischarin [Hyposmocoma kahamanoa]|uniref:nischarin n=1 Tax=Hyposmocoma kahamanoa TaxID=1477025 RepID=UPI000E6D9359|nr:nischarin [Hyposmocoma kahamanoa]XP_026332207.1 nischarin [Hyposmocoma kahamanoa]